MKEDYSYQPFQLDKKELTLVLKLLKEVWSTQTFITEQYLRWLYVDNPDGPALGYNAYNSQNELLGHYAIVPTRARNTNEATLMGALSLNTAVSEKARGRGLFTILANMTYQYAAKNGVKFIVGVANANSTPGFLKKLGFTNFGPLDAKVGLGFPTERKSPLIDFKRVWTEDSLTWRLKNPAATYRTLDRFIVGKWKPGMDVILKSFGEKKVRQGSQKAGFGPYLYIGRRPDLNFAPPKYWDIPFALRPSPLNLIFKPLAADFSIPKNPRLDAIDFDAF